MKKAVQKCCTPFSALFLNISDFTEKKTVGAETKLAMISLWGTTSQHRSITGLDPHAGELQKEGFNMFMI